MAVDDGEDWEAEEGEDCELGGVECAHYVEDGSYRKKVIIERLNE